MRAFLEKLKLPHMVRLAFCGVPEFPKSKIPNMDSFVQVLREYESRGEKTRGSESALDSHYGRLRWEATPKSESRPMADFRLSTKMCLKFT